MGKTRLCRATRLLDYCQLFLLQMQKANRIAHTYMKAIKTLAIIEGIRSRKDRSLGLSVTTPELTPAEKTLFMELQGINVEMSIKPLEEQVETHEIDTDVQQKSQSQRMRSVMYILYQQDHEGYQDFASYYHAKMEKLIDYLKGKIL